MPDLTDKKIRRGSFSSVADLIDAIEDYIRHHNDDPKPYKWTKTAEEIIEKVRRGRVALAEVQARYLMDTALVAPSTTRPRRRRFRRSRVSKS